MCTDIHKQKKLVNFYKAYIGSQRVFKCSDPCHLIGQYSTLLLDITLCKMHFCNSCRMSFGTFMSHDSASWTDPPQLTG